MTIKVFLVRLGDDPAVVTIEIANMLLSLRRSVSVDASREASVRVLLSRAMTKVSVTHGEMKGYFSRLSVANAFEFKVSDLEGISETKGYAFNVTIH